MAIKEKTGTEGANAEKRSEVAAFQEKRKMPKTKTREVYKVREENKRFVRCAMERRWTGRAGVAGLGHSSSINWDREELSFGRHTVSEPLSGFPLITRL